MKNLIAWMLLSITCYPLVQAQKTETIFYKGTIGRYPVELIMEQTQFKDEHNQTQTVYNARYYYLSQLRPIYLYGRIAENDSLQLASDEDLQTRDWAKEELRGKIAGDQFQGIWLQDGKQESFTLKVAAPRIRLKPYAYDLNVPFPKNKSIFGHYFADMMLPEDPVLQKTFLNQITGNAFSGFDEMAQTEGRNFQTSYLEEINEFYREEDSLSSHIYQYEFGSIVYPYINADEYLILAHSLYQYTGGAHGMYHVTYYNYNHRLKKILKVEDVFDLQQENRIARIIDKAIREKHHIAAGVPLSEGEDSYFIADSVGMSDNITISKRGITFHYGIYELTPYVYGMYDIFVSFEKLLPYLKKDFPHN